MSGDGDLLDLPAVAGFDDDRDRRLQNEREACWREFQAAADGFLGGDGGKAARAFLASVEGRFGAQEAEWQRKELWSWVKAQRRKHGNAADIR